MTKAIDDMIRATCVTDPAYALWCTRLDPIEEPELYAYFEGLERVHGTQYANDMRMAGVAPQHLQKRLWRLDGRD